MKRLEFCNGAGNLLERVLLNLGDVIVHAHFEPLIDDGDIRVVAAL